MSETKLKPFISDEIIEELKTILVEGEFASRWELIKTYHLAGDLIVKNFEDVAGAVHGLAEKLGKGERMLWYAVKFVRAYPDLDRLPEGKNVSMNKIITKYLTEPKAECTHEHKKRIVIEVCEDCDKNLGKVDTVQGE